MDKMTEEFLMRVSKHFCDGTMEYEDYYRFVRMAKVECIPEAAFLLNQMLKDLEVEDEDITADGDEDKEVEIIAGFLYHYSLMSTSFRDKYSGGMDNFDFITKNISSIVYNLFSKTDVKYTAIDLFKFAVVIDMKNYIESKDYDIDDICNRVNIVLKKNVLNLDSEYSLSNYIGDLDWTLTSCVVKIIALALSLIFKVDNPEMDENEIVNAIYGKLEHINDMVCDYFDDCDSFLKDEAIRRLVGEFLYNNEELVNQIVSSDKDPNKSNYKITDLDEYELIDYSDNIAGTGFTFNNAYVFVGEIEDKLDHEKEHNDYLKYLNEKKNEIASSIKQEIPNLNTELVLKMKNSVDLGNIKIAGICYLFGIEVEQNFEECFNLFMKGVKALDGESAYQISCMYLKSLHVRYDGRKWIEYLSLACRLGDENAIAQWKELKETARQYYSAKQERFKVKVIQENQRSAVAPVIFWLLFLLFLISGIVVVATVSPGGAVLLAISVVFLILAIVKTVQYSNSKKFLDEIKDK